MKTTGDKKDETMHEKLYNRLLRTVIGNVKKKIPGCFPKNNFDHFTVFLLYKKLSFSILQLLK